MGTSASIGTRQGHNSKANEKLKLARQTNVPLNGLGRAKKVMRQRGSQGWGWWLFNDPIVYDDHITWTADYLPAGTYELTYLLVLTHPGEFQVLPAHAWMEYFPEVQAISAGDSFVIAEE